MVDGDAAATSMSAANKNNDTWTISWVITGDASDVDHWGVCYQAGDWTVAGDMPTTCKETATATDTSVDITKAGSSGVFFFAAVPVDDKGNTEAGMSGTDIQHTVTATEETCETNPDLEGCDELIDDGDTGTEETCETNPDLEGCDELIDDGDPESQSVSEDSSGLNLIFFGGIGISVIFIVLAITVVLKRGGKKSELARSSSSEAQRLGSVPLYGGISASAPVQRQQIAPPQPSQALFPPQPVPMPIPSSTAAPLSLQQRFAVAEMLAEGGMAEVYKATEKSTGEVVVWKQAHGKHNPLSVSNMKLEEEAELMQIIPHPRIPKYITHGKITDNSGKGKVVMVQEFIEGGDLKNTVDQIMKVGASISIDKIIEYLLAICEPLEHMANMAEPIYHRDLKPHNVIIHPSRGPVLIDFGLAKMVATGEDISVTRGGSGTWTPPERDAGISGPFTDVWSLGKIMFYLCTNQKPAVILAEVDMQAVYAIGHPQWVGELILKAVNPRYQERVESVAWFKYLLNTRGDWEEMGSTQTTSSDDFTTWG
jgi:hypothetical protein